MTPDQQALLAKLRPELRRLLDAELAAGNVIEDVGVYGFARTGNVLSVMLREPFKARPAELPAGVEFVAVNDPHWWHSEYNCGDQMLACRFG